MYLELPELRMAPTPLGDLYAAILRLNLQPGPGGSHIFDLSISTIVDQFWSVWSGGGFLRSCGVVALWPSSQIVAHCDPPIQGVRHHVPIQTNLGCWSFSEGVWQQLALGSVYRMDPTKEHGAVNWGSEIRLHLMIDVEEG